MSHVTRHALCPACGRFIVIHDGARIAHQIAHVWSGLDDQRRRHAIDECAGSRTAPTPEELASGLAHDLLMVDVQLAKARAQLDHYHAQVERLMTERTALMEGV